MQRGDPPENAIQKQPKCRHAEQSEAFERPPAMTMRRRKSKEKVESRQRPMKQ
jgi:hypothetical protein